MGRSEEFDRDGDPDVTKTVLKTAPLGLLPILIIVLAFVIIGLVVWWMS